MRYACLIYYNPKTLFGGSPEAKAVLAECSTHDDKLKESGHFVMGEALELPDAAMTVQVRNGKMSATDGPFMETKEMLGGIVLIEARDLAFGTSRWSSKLVHGGLRYLAHGHVRLARESAVERDILMRRTAPHLTRPMAQLFPRYANTPQSTYALTVAGVGAGDALRRLAGTPSSVLPRPRSVPAAQALTLVPGLRETGLRGGLLAFDGTLTDGRIHIGPQGEAMKSFSVRDGFGLTLLREAGIRLAVVTARRSSIVEHRAAELKFDVVLQGVGDKASALAQLCTTAGIALDEAGFVGDDWPDLPAMLSAGFAASVADAPSAGDPRHRQHDKSRIASAAACACSPSSCASVASSVLIAMPP